MAAHVLTIANQILTRMDEDRQTYHEILRYADGALGAPGTDAFSYPCLRMEIEGETILDRKELYDYLYCAVRGLFDDEHPVRLGLPEGSQRKPSECMEQLHKVCLMIQEHCRHLQHYRSLEAANSAWKLFVRPGTPYWRKRDAKWQAWGPELEANPPQPESYYL